MRPIFAAFVLIISMSNTVVDANADTAQILENYGNTPLAFTVNKGQVNEQAAFTTRENGCTIFFSPQGTTYLLSKETEVSIAPNPANPRTTISYSLPEASNVRLDVYSISGQKVTTLIDDMKSPGIHTVKFNGSNIATGVYLFKFESNKFRKTGRLLLIK